MECKHTCLRHHHDLKETNFKTKKVKLIKFYVCTCGKIIEKKIPQEDLK